MAETETDPKAKAVPPHPRGYRLRRGRNWFFLGLLYAGYYLCRYNLGIVSPELTQEFGLNKEQYGGISSARDGGYAVGQFVNGLFTDGMGGRQAMAVGALGTILFNVLFGVTSMSGITWMLTAFILLRLFDGYMQSFGAPGMVKINTSWFQRRERGRFAGIFGGMIQLGAIGVGELGKFLLLGLTIGGVVILHRQGWRSMFFVPPAILLVILVVAWLNVKNHPEEAGFKIPHDDDEHGGGNIHERLPLGYVFRKIASSWVAWVNAGAYFCTGFVRRAVELFWVLYIAEKWGADKKSGAYSFLVWALPISAFVGSFTSGILSDTLFKGKRAPVAALLYTLETIVIASSVYLLGHSGAATTTLAVIMLTLISLTCNSTHSIIGTAAAMDLGGRKMAGFALGVINSFQYYGAIIAGWVLGGWIDKHGWDALFLAMLPFSAVGALLMIFIWLTTRGRDVKGS
jgi:MFS transporter, OPA family, glycerol-3-phosphate transporter